MKLNLVRLARAQGRVAFPNLEGFEAIRFTQPQEMEEGRLYLLLKGEAVIDLPDQSYLHLRVNDAAHLSGPHRLVPIEEAIIAVWKLSW